MILELTKAVIGLGLIAILGMYAQFLTNNREYQRLAEATAILRGCLWYRLNRTLRGFWSSVYELEDKLRGNKVHSIKYF